MEGGAFKEKRITYHDSCYLGRANNIYEAPREVLQSLDADLVEMKRCKTAAYAVELVCADVQGRGAWKQGDHIERTEEALETKPDFIATGCPFCMTMMSDGIKNKEKENSIKVMDLAELLAKSAE